MTLMVDNIVKTFGENESETQVLKGINFEVQDGEFVILNGASGSGKTTLLTILGGLLSPTSGKLIYEESPLFNNNNNTKMRLNDIGFIFQASYLIPYLTVEEQLITVGKEAGMSKREAKLRANELLDEIGLTHRVKSYPYMLSGGEKQRVAIMRAFMNHPKIILADEPTASLDAERARDVVAMIKEQISDKRMIGIMITHDESLFKYADRVIELYDGKIIN
ncbi:ABC transporter ATP-binding protein [Staphylococcus capitis]|uniref:Putative hemin import ATP-binding protein HrtA n=2 Tax=Staphylococcus TaxID=1279 RepID=A0A7X9ZK86_STACP|nr:MULTISPECIES: ABC transporter ATP-binding protein [Staphylococcus]AKL92634.1 Putative hemin import ATP-binding protein HrtA [Staphylococcus capitis subsp. capitis]ATN02027.1 ABC transporter ATP-binding protein [Staphylococcus capitis]KDE94827.1 hemin ABC transporter ATP-binding protein [Staphylococcus sp. TE8]MBC3080611.1 ABC transporter ATP-binding protein [Staphylococcus capitis]MBC8780424.1 ABC transporter ATP-binding protein [Staphylococcus capitis]